MILQLQRQNPSFTQCKLEESQNSKGSVIFKSKRYSVNQSQCKVRCLQQPIVTQNDLTKFKSFQNVGASSCFRCKEQKKEKIICLCQCQHLSYHLSCIQNHIRTHLNYGISAFQCQHCSEYFQIKIQENNGLQNLTFKEKLLLLLLFSALILMVLFEIILIIILTLQIVYKLLIIISIILELILLLIFLRLVYQKCQSVEFEVLEYDEHNKPNKQNYEKMVKKILQTFSVKRTLKIDLNISF